MPRYDKLTEEERAAYRAARQEALKRIEVLKAMIYDAFAEIQEIEALHAPVVEREIVGALCAFTGLHPISLGLAERLDKLLDYETRDLLQDLKHSVTCRYLTKAEAEAHRRKQRNEELSNEDK